MTLEEINTMKYRVCCPMCDNKKCVRGTDSCEAEQWAKRKALGQEPVDYKAQYENYLKKSEVVISQLRADRDRLRDDFDKARAEIADLADSDAYGDYQQGFNFGLMRAAQIIDKYRTESEDEE